MFDSNEAPAWRLVFHLLPGPVCRHSQSTTAKGEEGQAEDVETCEHLDKGISGGHPRRRESFQDSLVYRLLGGIDLEI